MPGRRKTAARVALLVVGGAILAAAVYIMVRRIGLNPDLDFGAGAYYYADIPDYEKRLNWDVYEAQLPFWVYVVLFLAWGALMYWLWKRMEMSYQNYNNLINNNTSAIRYENIDKLAKILGVPVGELFEQDDD